LVYKVKTDCLRDEYSLLIILVNHEIGFAYLFIPILFASNKVDAAKLREL
jgi:hypothetical protein